jgi:tRNA A-37 threonylcarbamoyl transferase component Bud32/WD40 repeat protein
MCPAPHPDFQHLADYATGKLPQEKATSIAQHLTECPECESTIQALESKSDTLVSGLQVKPPVEPYAGETELRRAVANAAQIPAGAKPQANVGAASPEKVSTKGPVKLGPYQLLAKLGEGGMGAVFKARHEHLEKIVAIKVLPKKAMSDPAAVARFRREMKAVGALHHPNIVGAHDAGEQQGVHFLVMEYVEGSDLSSLIKKNGPVTVEQAISYMQQAAKGLAFAHGKSIVHRDIKPANLLVDVEGTVKILDMGLARLDDGASANAEANQGLTQTGQVMGTVDYMAPEQAFDTHRADAKADVYSLGCTLYRILTGQNAYSGDTVVQKILAHREQPIPSICKIRGDTPPGLDALCTRMLAKRPEDRPTMADVAKELEALEKGTGDRGQGTEEVVGAAIVVDVRPQSRLAASLATRVPAKPKPSAKPHANAGAGRGFRPPKKLVAAAAAGAFAIIALGVWLYIRNERNEIVAKVDATNGTPRIEISKGDSVQVVADPVPTPTATAAVSSPPPTFLASSTPGSPLPSSSAPEGYALSFSLGASVELPGVTAKLDMAGPMTMEAWVTPHDAVEKALVPIIGGGGAGIQLADNRWGFNGFWEKLPESTKNYYVVVSAPRAREKLRRTHVACVRTDKQVVVYIDGVPLSSQDVPPLPLKRYGLLTLGGVNEANDKLGFNGLIDEVRFSHVARYEKPFTPPQRFETDADTLALYHFDEGAGDVLRDSSGNKHDGKIIGAKWVQADGSPLASPSAAPSGSPPSPSGYALSFGDGASVEIPSLTDQLDAGKRFTIECWVTPSYLALNQKKGPASSLAEFQGEVPVLGFQHGPPLFLIINNSGNWSFNLQANELLQRTESRYGATYALQPAGIVGGSRNIFLSGNGDGRSRRWHLAVVRNGNRLQFFRDGKLHQSVEFPNITIKPAVDSFTLGGKHGEPARYFHGLIDEVRLSQAAKYDKDFTPAEQFAADADTIALYHFDEGAGDVLRDSSGNNHHGKIVSATWVRADGSPSRLPDEPSQIVAVPRTPLPDGPPGQLPSISVPANPRMIVVAGDGRHVGFMGGPGHPAWLDLTTGKTAWENTTGRAAYIRGSRLSPDGTRWALAGHVHDSNQAYVRILRTADGSEEWSYTAAGPEFIGVAFSPNGKQLAVGNDAGEVRVFELPVGRELRRWQAHDSAVMALAYSRDGLRLVTGAAANTAGADAAPAKQPTLKMWRLPDGVEVPDFFQPRERFSMVDTEVTRDGRFLLLGTTVDTAVIWDMQAGAKLALIRNEANGQRNGNSETPSGTHALVGGDTMLIVESATGRVVQELRDAESRRIHKPIPTPDGRFAIAHGEKLLRIWRLPPECWAPGISSSTPAAAAVAANKTLADPAFQAWLKATQALPADKQLEAVSKKLMELNPGFDGKLTDAIGTQSPGIDAEGVVAVGITSDEVTNLSPLRALRTLRYLACNGNKFGKGKLADLLPLEGLPLQHFTSHTSAIADLSTLAKCKSLKSLRILGTHVTAEQVAALQTALPSCKVEWDGVTDAPGTERRIAEWVLQVGGDVQVLVDRQPVTVRELRELPAEPFWNNSIAATKVATNEDLAQLAKCVGLTNLNLNFTSVDDAGVSRLKGLSKLQSLSLMDTRITDAVIAQFAGYERLTHLNVKGTRVTAAGFAKLQKMLPNCKIEWDDPAKTPAKPLTYLDPKFQLWLVATQKLPAEQQLKEFSKKLMELNPSFDGKLTGAHDREKPQVTGGIVLDLGINTDQVSNIAPIRALTGLQTLFCRGTTGRPTISGKLTDLSPLSGMQLTSLQAVNPSGSHVQ